MQTDILDFLAKRGPQAATIYDLRDATGHSVDQLWSALLRLRPTGKVFRFGVDAEEYMVLTEHRVDAYADVPFTLSEDVAMLYAGIGTHAPKTIRRTPQFVVLDDDEVGQAYSRYQEIEEMDLDEVVDEVDEAEDEPFDLDELEDVE